MMACVTQVVPDLGCLPSREKVAILETGTAVLTCCLVLAAYADQT